MHLPSVAIVILNWNGKNWLEKFLPSVVATGYANKRIIVADNASTDDSVLFLKSNYPAIEIIRHLDNQGFAQGYNTALFQTDADYFVLLNSDVEVAPDWVRLIIEFMEKDPAIGACQPKILSYNDKRSFEYAGAAGGWIDYLGYPFARGRVFNHCETDNGQYNEPSAIFWASGAALFVRSFLYKQLNGLDGSFFAHQEEIDFCWRLQLAGYKIMVCPDAVVYHVGGGTLKKENPRKTYLNFRNNLMMLEKNLPKKGKNLLILKRLILNDLAAIQFLLNGNFANFVSVIKAELHFIRWKFWKKKICYSGTTRLRDLPGVAHKSIVYNYFIKKKKTYSEIVDL